MSDQDKTKHAIRFSHEGIEYEVPVTMKEISDKEGWDVLLEDGSSLTPYLTEKDFIVKLPEVKGYLWVREWLGMIPIPDKVDYLPFDRDGQKFILANKVE